jgi:hypothetical protein
LTLGLIVVDPGHGGMDVVGRSTPYGSRGAGALTEKHVVLDIARRLRAHAPERVLLTRDGDHNLSLADRIFAARRACASAFLSIHAGGAAGAHDVWLHSRTNENSQRFGAGVARAVANTTGTPAGAPRTGPLAILDPDFHAPDVAACLLELDGLERSSGGELADPRHRQRIADALAEAVLFPGHALLSQSESLVSRGDSRSHSESWSASLSLDDAALGRTLYARSTRFDVWHEVPLVQQLTGMSCWAAAAAMIVGWRDCIDIDADDVARGAGRWQSYRDGLEPRDVAEFAREWGLEVARPSSFSVDDIRRLLEEFGPLWVGEASPGLHVIVVAGIHGDTTKDGTFVRIADPWPIGRGERYTLSFREFERNLRAATELSGGSPQILHAAAGARQARGWGRAASSLTERSGSWPPPGSP